MIGQLILFGMVLLFSSQLLLSQWKSAGDKIRTFWTAKVDVSNLLPEYLSPIEVKVETDNNKQTDRLEVKVFNVKLWSLDSPFLYQMEVLLFSAGKQTDRVQSYVATRKYSMQRDEYGIVRLQLNNKDLFQFGPGDRMDYLRLLQIWKEVIDLYSYPCIGTWILFNEAWEQFKTQETAEWSKQYDPSRLVNSASGGNS